VGQNAVGDADVFDLRRSYPVVSNVQRGVALETGWNAKRAANPRKTSCSHGECEQLRLSCIDVAMSHFVR
jgi:hypothetical protein